MNTDLREYVPPPGSPAAPEWTPKAPPLTPAIQLDHETPSDEILILPGDETPISTSAKRIFRALAKRRDMFTRGGTVVELRTDLASGPVLSVLRPDEFRSRLERAGRLMAYRTMGNGERVLAERRCPKECAAALLATLEAIEILPPISLVSQCPVLVRSESGLVVAGEGYTSAAGGILVTQAGEPVDMPVDEAREVLCEMLADFDFVGDGDRARALAAVVTPALRMGGLLRGFAPVHAVEANASQSGKGYLHRLVRAIYNDSGYTIARRDGGVGGADESLSAALLSGRPFVELDNVRGAIDSQFLEMLLTREGGVPCRVPHRGEVQVDASRTTFQLTSNGIEATPDLANRSSIVRIRRRPQGYAFRQFPEGDVLRHVEAHRSRYLGAVFAIARAWHEAGRPRTGEARHDFRDWAQSLDWISKTLLATGPLMDGHQVAQARVANPALSWLRLVALAVNGREERGREWTASQLLDLCGEEGIAFPGRQADADEMLVGRLMTRAFGSSDRIEVDGGLRVERRSFPEYDPKQRRDVTRRVYSFEAPRPAHHAHKGGNFHENGGKYSESYTLDAHDAHDAQALTGP